MFRGSSSVLVWLSLALFGCDGSRITVGPELESFASVSLNWAIRESVYIENIQVDEWIPGNVLATIGSSLYTISPSGETKLLVGSAQERGFKNGVGEEARFNKTSGIAQLHDGLEVIIADFSNTCLRKMDRLSRVVTTFAGSCSPSDCVTKGRLDGPLVFSTFCHPTRLRYVKSEHKLMVLDLSRGVTAIRSIDLATSLVTTIFKSPEFFSYDFVVGEDKSSYTFPLAPGILHFTSSNDKEWLVGCPNETISNNTCSSNPKLREVSMQSPHKIEYRNGVMMVSAFGDFNVYIIDVENNEYVELCGLHGISYCYLHQPIGLALIGDYLYIGESLRPNFYYHDIYIKRVRLSVTSTYDLASGDAWMEIGKKLPATATVKATTSIKSTTAVSFRTHDAYAAAVRESKSESPPHTNGLIIAAFIIAVIALIIVGGILLLKLSHGELKVSKLRAAAKSLVPVSKKVPHTRLEEGSSINLHINNSNVGVMSGGENDPAPTANITKSPDVVEFKSNYQQ